jgi:D-alanyl-lipoteichoic acid acyltransferase DltB (MBOAT superfamily)
MNYISIGFALFVILTAVLYFLVPYRFRWLVLLVASYVFYLFAEPAFLPVLMGITAVSYVCGLLMGKREDRGVRGKYLIAGIVLQVSCLLFFKYQGFFVSSLSSLLQDLNVTESLPELRLLVPLGISFYTLQSLSYLVDVYRGDMKPEKHPGYLALYVAFFPTILAGPIERGTHLLPQLHGRYDFEYDRVTDSMRLIARGLIKKLVIADRLAIFVNQVFGNVRAYRGLPLLVAAFLYAFQLYCDFSGYTDIVRGVAGIFGYDLLINFNLPYLARNVREFWQRWHISMTSWFRDYLYIPLGGNKVSIARTYLNIMIVFLVSGFWHGANWTFIAWGGLHGVYQVVGRATTKIRERTRSRLGIDSDGWFARSYQIILTFCLVDFAWIFFRAESLGDARYIVRNMFSPSNALSGMRAMLAVAEGGRLEFLLSVGLILGLVLLEIIQSHRALDEDLKRQPVYVRWTVYTAAMTAILIFGIAGSPQFVYIRF